MNLLHDLASLTRRRRLAPQPYGDPRKMALRGGPVEAPGKIATALPSTRRAAANCAVAGFGTSKIFFASVGLFRRHPERLLEAPDIGRPRLRIDQARWPVAIECVQHLFGGDPAHVRARLFRHPRGMGA